jgi:hypothetical protein
LMIDPKSSKVHCSLLLFAFNYFVV